MDSYKVVSVLGARPQFIKAAPLIALIEQEKDIQHFWIHTGQHYSENMSDVFISDLALSPASDNLGIGSGSHAVQTGKMMKALEERLLVSQADLLLIYGDTNSTLAAAVVGTKLGLPIAHIEAGLRSYNRAMPEEINRIVADRYADLLFAPTALAEKNLVSEGFDKKNIKFVGDLMVDAVHRNIKRARKKSRILKTVALENEPFVLATFHRQENTDVREHLINICEALQIMSARQNILLPLHPRSKKKIEEFGINLNGDKLKIIEAVGYLDMLRLLDACKILLTDSGGMQKEAFALSKPVVTLRAETEWRELVDAGLNRLVPPNSSEAIIAAAEEMTKKEFSSSSYAFYGKGHSAERILAEIIRFLEKS